MKFVSLHHHSTFSYLDGFGPPEAHVARAAEIGMDTLALTEHGNVSSHVRLEKAAKQHDVKPVFGCELYTGAIDADNRTQKKNHLTLFAKDQTGYQNLLRVVSRGWDEGFYYEPTVDGRILRDHAKGLIVTSGCTASLVATSLVGGKNIDPAEAGYRRARDVVARFQEFFGDDYYLEVQAIPELADVCAINEQYERIANELGVPLVATCDVHYTKPTESEFRKILHGQRPSAKGKNKGIEQIGQEFDYTIDASPPICDRTVYDRLRRTGLSHRAAREAVLNTRRIASACTVTLPRIQPLTYPLPDGVPDSRTLYRKWLNDGWRARGFDKLPANERDMLIERVEYENSLIEEKGFIDYFLVLSDAVQYAKRQGIAVGPARGSAAASLVCYLLHITEVNPMNHPALVFERFIDKTRVDLPDIDLDFDDVRRHEVHNYLVEKYGADHVGSIGTFTQYKGKNSLDDVARVYRVPSHEVERVKELLLERSSGDLRASATIEDTVEMFEQAKDVFDRYPSLYNAQHLEGNVRGMSVHAAGLVVANEPLTNACATYARTDKQGNKTEVLSVDKYDADYLNVLKIDVLGLKTMGLIGLALDEIGMTLNEMYQVPLDDPVVLEGFQDNDVVGVFQFDGRATRSVNGSLVPESFTEICDINALARPGPLHSGATAEYIDVKHGRKEPIHYHPIVDEITKTTQYQVVYQEQILRIVRELGGFDWEEAARIRKIISKKRGEQEFNKQREKFIDGAAQHDMDADAADTVWKMLATAGAYAFNAAHCVSYGMLAWWTMWLKRYHPTAFYSAALQKHSGNSDKDKRDQLLRDTAKKDIEIRPPSLHRSGLTWQSEGDALRMGVIQVPGIGPTMAEAVMDFRENCEDWRDLQKMKGVGPKTVQKIEAFVNDPDPFNLDLLKNKLNELRAQLLSGDFEDEDGAPLPYPSHTSLDVPYDRGQDEIVVWLGVIRERNYKDLFELHHSRTGEHLDPDSVKDPNLVNWLVMLGEDDQDILTVTVDRWKWPHFSDICWNIRLGRDLVLVRGVKKGYQARRAIYVEQMWVFDVEDEEGSEGAEMQDGVA